MDLKRMVQFNYTKYWHHQHYSITERHGQWREGTKITYITTVEMKLMRMLLVIPYWIKRGMKNWIFLNNIETNAYHMESNWSSALEPDTNLGWEYRPRVISVAKTRKEQVWTLVGTGAGLNLTCYWWYLSLKATDFLHYYFIIPFGKTQLQWKIMRETC
jgi:hypothetical protein